MRLLEHQSWCWSWICNTLATWCDEPIHWKRLWCWERLKAGGEGDDKGWDGWMALQMQWTCVWVGSGGWWWTGRPGVLQSMGSQRIGHDWATELNWIVLHPAQLFHVMYSVYKLNKQDNNTQPWPTPFPVLNQSAVPCLVLTVASWPTCRFLRRQVRWSITPISLRIFHSLLWSTLLRALLISYCLVQGHL